MPNGKKAKVKEMERIIRDREEFICCDQAGEFDSQMIDRMGTKYA